MRLQIAGVRKLVRTLGNEEGLAAVLGLRTLPSSAPYIGSSAYGLVCKLSLVVALLAFFCEGRASAQRLVCEGAQIDDSALMSPIADGDRPQIVSLLGLVDAKRDNFRLECDDQNLDDCDMKLPSGQPQLPSPHTRLRPSAALPGLQESLPPHTGAFIPHAAPQATCLAGFSSQVFRPPQN